MFSFLSRIASRGECEFSVQIWCVTTMWPDSLSHQRSTFHNLNVSCSSFWCLWPVIAIIGENKDTDLLKELSVVCHSFLHICSKYLFATVDLHDAFPNFRIASSMKGFVKLLKSRPGVVNYIRKLTYKTEDNDCYRLPYTDNDDDLLSPILPNSLRTIPRLNFLKINASTLNWHYLNSSLT